MTDRFRADVFEEWQALVGAWDRVEKELKALEADPVALKSPQGAQRAAQLETELAVLRANMDAMVAQNSKSRDKVSQEMLVALIDTRPDSTSFAQMVREKLFRSAKRR